MPRRTRAVRGSRRVVLHGLLMGALIAIFIAGGVASGVLQSERAAAKNRAETAALKHAAERPRVAFIGDSYTAGNGGEGVRWSAVVSKSKDWVEQNYAVGGTGYVVFGSASACHRAYCPPYGVQLAAVVADKPDIVIVAGGRNDLHMDPVVVGSAAKQLFKTIRATLPKAKVLVLSPWWDSTKPPVRLVKEAAQVKAAARAAGVRYLDVGQPLRGHPELIGADGVHPNPDGYKVLGRSVIKVLRANGF